MSDVGAIRSRLADPRALCAALGLLEGALPQPNGLHVRCPGHGDKGPSCSVTRGPDGTIRVKCFAGCEHVQGDALTLIAAVYRLDVKKDFREVLEIGARLAGVALEDRSSRPDARPSAPQPAPPPRKAPERFHEIASDLLSLCPLDAPEGGGVRAYLAKRGLLEEARADRWGAVPPGAEYALAAPLEARFGRDVLLASGLFSDGRSGVRLKWSGHVLVIPFRDERDEIVALQRRRIVPPTRREEPSYVTAGRPRSLYGRERVSLAPGGAPVAYTEGALDALALRSLLARSGRAVVVLGVAGVDALDDEGAVLARGRLAFVATDADPHDEERDRPGPGDRAAARWAKLLWSKGAAGVQRVRPALTKDWAELTEKLAREPTPLEGLWTETPLADGDVAPRALVDQNRQRLPPQPPPGVTDEVSKDKSVTSFHDPSGANRPDPTVMTNAGTEEELHEIAIRSLCGMDSWYERGGEIVTTRSARDGGEVSIAPVSYPTFYTRLCGRLRWMKWKTEGRGEEKTVVKVDCGAPRAVAESVFRAGEWPSLPLLVGVRDTPLVRPDGSLFQEPGHDPITNCLYVPSASFPRVDDHPSVDDARQAMARLTDLFRDFTYLESGMASVALSAIFSLIGREAIAGAVPMHLFSSPQSGVGKSLQMQVVSQIALGHDMIPFHLPMPREDDRGQSDLEEEQEKRFAGAAREGSRALMIENQRNGGLFGGPVIDKYLTASDRVQVRILGVTGNPTYPWRPVWCVSANNLHVVNDTKRRCIGAVIAPTCAHPELRDQRQFKYPLATGYALEHRNEIVLDVLTVLVAHARAGRPRTARADLSNFERWQAAVADAIVWAGGADPASFVLVDDADLTGDDTVASSLMRVLALLKAYRPHSDEGVKPSDIIERIWSDDWLLAQKERLEGPPEHPAIVDARETFTEAWRLPRGKRPAAKVLSAKFRDLCGRVLQGSDVWSSDDTSGLQRGEWRVYTTVDRNKSPRYILEPPVSRKSL